jgi:hypothetical protein
MPIVNDWIGSLGGDFVQKEIGFREPAAYLTLGTWLRPGVSSKASGP